MKNVMKKVIIVAILVMAVMAMCGFTWETEGVPEALIEELEFEGFAQSEDEENIWTYELYLGEIGQRTYVYGRFDTNENIGMVMAQRYTADGHIAEICSSTFSWNAETDCFDELAYTDREF